MTLFPCVVSRCPGGLVYVATVLRGRLACYLCLRCRSTFAETE